MDVPLCDSGAADAVIDVRVHRLDVSLGEIGRVRQVRTGSRSYVVVVEVCSTVGLGVCHAQRVSELVCRHPLEVLTVGVVRIDLRPVQHRPAHRDGGAVRVLRLGNPQHSIWSPEEVLHDAAVFVEDDVHAVTLWAADNVSDVGAVDVRQSDQRKVADHVRTER